PACRQPGSPPLHDALPTFGQRHPNAVCPLSRVGSGQDLTILRDEEARADPTRNGALLWLGRRRRRAPTWRHARWREIGAEEPAEQLIRIAAAPRATAGDADGGCRPDVDDTGIDLLNDGSEIGKTYGGLRNGRGAYCEGGTPQQGGACPAQRLHERQ